MTARVTRSTAFAQALREQDGEVLSFPASGNIFSSLPDLRHSLPSSIMRICHHCHTPQSEPVHVGIPTGVGQCILPHWEHCTLNQTPGYDKHKKLWTGCTDVVQDTQDESDTVAGLSLDETGDGSDKDITLRKQLPKNLSEAAAILDAATVESRGARQAAALLDSLASKKILVASDQETEDDTDAEEDRLAREELDALRNRVELQQKQIDEDNALAVKLAKQEKRKTNRLRIEQQKAELLQREKDLKASLAASRRSARAQSSVPASADRFSVLKGIKNLPGPGRQVDAHSSGVHFQPSGMYSSKLSGGTQLTADNGLKVDTEFVYIPELGKVVPIVSSQGASPTRASMMRRPEIIEHHVSDSEVSAEDDCPVSPAPGFRLAWKRDTNGEKYCEEVQVRDKSPEIVATWVKRSDGRIYKQEVPMNSSRRSAVSTTTRRRTPVTTSPKGGSDRSYVEHRHRGKQTPASERQPSFITSEDRAGKETGVPSLVQRARSCPVSWTDKITSEQLNPIVWSWAYVQDLLCARSGQAPALESGELEARLQHFLNVMEVTLQTSSKTDYMGDSWKVARLYHTKVQAKVDQGATSWCKMDDRWESSTLPHELMAAQQELAPRPTKTKTRELDKVKEGEGRKCGWWNDFETKGICKWESDNPGEKCNRIHECTYCKTKKLDPVNHQRLFCPKRLATGAD